MKSLKVFLAVALVALAVSALSACGGASPVTISDIPAFPGATELQPGDSRIAQTLQNNSQQITAMTQSLGAGGKTDQKGYALPKDASWDAVKKFYDDKLKGAGWSEPNSTASNILAQVNGQNDAFQMANYTRGNQSLSVLRVMTDPVAKDETLIFSLSTR